MPPEQRRVWTTSRKVMGNVLPLVVASPLLIKAVLVFAHTGPSVVAILWAALFPVGAWLAVALLGLAGNRRMKNEVSRRMHIDRPFDKTEKYFIGIATPSFKSVLDPHEDVGFLVVHQDQLEFYGSERHLLLNKRDIMNIRLTPNTHTIIGLGRWIAIEAIVRNISARLLVEPRERRTLIGNLLFSRRLFDRLVEWNTKDPRTDVRGSFEAPKEP